jgi:hypothetical protein
MEEAMNTLLKQLLTALSLGVLVTSPPAYASPIVWTLEDVTFQDGATASGSFSYDATVDDYSAWNIFVSANAGRPDSARKRAEAWQPGQFYVIARNLVSIA